jgi:hypothetical protein
VQPFEAKGGGAWKEGNKPALPPMKCSEINQERDKGQSTEENDREENRSRPENPRR